MLRDHISPWDNQNEQHSAILEPELDPEKYHEEPYIENSSQFPSIHMSKHSKKYKEILPRVYQKQASTPQLHSYKKKQRSKLLSNTPTPITRNQITITLPNTSSPAPKISKDLHVKHSIRPLKHLATYIVSQQKPQKCQYEQIQKMKKKLRKSSTEIQEKQLYQQLLKKINKNDQQIIKKCSLKNLQIYEPQSPHRMNQKCNYLVNKKIEESLYAREQKRHILDRILTRLQ